MEFSISMILILAGIAMLAGFIDAIAGGGGLITIPALLIAGLNPVSAIATNKLQASSASLSATIVFARKGLIHWKTALPIAMMSFLGGGLGAMFVSLLPKSVLLVIVPILLFAVVIYFITSPKLDDIQSTPKLTFFLFGLMIAPVIGFYDGIFGPGTGSFFLIAFIYLMGMKLMTAMSYTKLANVASNLGSLGIFLIKGAVIFPIGLAMALGAIIGAQIGARFAVKFGSKLVKPLLIVVSIIMIIRLLLDKANPIRLYVESLF